MKVLVTAASRYGATSEIAEAVGDVLRKHGLDTTVAQPSVLTTSRRTTPWCSAAPCTRGAG